MDCAAGGAQQMAAVLYGRIEQITFPYMALIRIWQPFAISQERIKKAKSIARLHVELPRDHSCKTRRSPKGGDRLAPCQSRRGFNLPHAS